jgi:hypothetical protein
VREERQDEGDGGEFHFGGFELLGTRCPSCSADIR